ncbi:hypothetical protein Tco_1308914 [Tanacetum coccineum]
MDDPNLTMEEYIRLEEEKAQKCWKVFNWQTATYGKIRVDNDLHNLSSVEAEFPSIVINDAVATLDELQCKSQVSTPVNDEIDFRISFDESDDEDYTIFFDKNSFSYKMISVNDLKTDSENDYDKVMPSIPSLEPVINCFDDFFTDFENEFLAIINDLFPFNIIHPDMALLPRKQRHKFLRYKGLEYPDTDIVNFEGRLARIHRREVHRVLVFDFEGLPDLMAEGLSGRMLMEHRDEASVSVFTSRAWRRMLDIRGPLVHELILDFFSMFRFGQAILDLDTLGTLQLIACSIAGRSQAPEKVTVTDLFYMRGMDVGSVNVPYLLARYLRLFAAGRKSGVHISGGQFVARLAEHFGLLTAEILGGLTVIAPELPIIDMTELVRLQICAQLDDTWAWVAMRPERQPDAAAGALDDAEDASIVDEGGQADPAPVQAPQQPPPPPPASAKTIPQRLVRLEEDVQGLRRDIGSLRGLVERSMTDQGRFSTWMMTCMTHLMDASGLTYQAFDGTLRGSSPASFQRQTRQRTGEASTSAA